MDNPNWTNMFFYSTVYVTAQNDCCYALTTSGDIYNYLFNTGNWFQVCIEPFLNINICAHYSIYN